MSIQVYLFFNGKCDEALDFYKQTLGAEVEMLMRYRENPEPMPPGAIPDGFENKVMHCSFRVGDTTVMASDGNCADAATFDGFTLHISAPTPEEAERLFDALKDGGRITMPIAKTFWATRFGMLVDRFGVHWMVSTVEQA
jgi:PhnB protein